MTPKKVHVRERIEDVDCRGACVFSDHHLDRCTLSTCHAHSKSHLERPVFRRIVVANCRLESTDAHGAIFDDCTIDGLRNNRLSMITGCAFRHVTIRGDIGQFLVRASKDPGVDVIDRANLRFYENVDWALDIRDARPATLDIRDVPLHLIRRNPETQAIVRKARLAYEEMVHLGLGPTATQLLSTFLPHGPDQKLFVAGGRSKTYQSWIQAFDQLRKVGLAE
jgi:hypothetical protein